MRSNRLRARRFRNDALNRSTFELLEKRVLMCGSIPDMVAAGIPRAMIQDDGHIAYSDFITLPEKLRSQIDKHLIVSQQSESPINWDQVLGLPASATRSATATPDAAPVATVALPDFFPSLYNGFAIDQSSQPGRTLLKFGTQVNNQGAGPASLISGRPGIDTIPTGAGITSWTNTDGSQNVLQAVYNFDGTKFALDHYQLAGKFTYHPGHGHFHYDGYAYYRLRSKNPDGTAGAYVTRTDGTGIVGEKVGFCLLDFVTGNPPFITESGAASTSLPGYGKAGQPGNGCNLIQGVTVGNADGYSNSLQGQWLDVTGVANGSYFLEISLDGQNAVQETNETNNTKTFAYTLNVGATGTGIAQDEYDAGNTENDTFATATNLGTLGTWQKTGMTIHWGQDFDYYKFVASSTGSATVSTTFSNGDVNLYVYDASQTQIGASTNATSGTTSSPATETVTYNFTAGQTYYFMINAYNSTTSNNYLFKTTLKPSVNSLATSATTVEDSGKAGKINITRNGPLDDPITVNFAISGTATLGVDYTLQTSAGAINGNTFTIGDNATFGTIDIVPINDHVVERKESVILTITSGTTYVSISGPSVVTIMDGASDDNSQTGSGGADGGSFGGAGAFGLFARGAHAGFNNASRITLSGDEDRLTSGDAVDLLTI